MPHTAIYLRVSTDAQTEAAQLAACQKWAQGFDGHIKYYSDTGTGTKLDRTNFKQMMANCKSGQCNQVVVWRMDRLGRTASGLAKLFTEFNEMGINFISLTEGVDLSTPAGRLMAHVIASVAQYETEVRGERCRAGIAAAKAKGRFWGGSKPGPTKLKQHKIRDYNRFRDSGLTVYQAARAVEISPRSGTRLEKARKERLANEQLRTS